jgi:hypothetical protein
MVYYHQGKYDDALKFFHETMEIREKVLGLDRPDTKMTCSNMELVYLEQGKDGDALEQFQISQSLQRLPQQQLSQQLPSPQGKVTSSPGCHPPKWFQHQKRLCHIRRRDYAADCCQ